MEQDLLKKEKTISKNILFNNSAHTTLFNKQLPQIHNTTGISNFNSKSNFFTKTKFLSQTDEKSFHKNALLNRKNATYSVDKRKQEMISKTKSFKELLQKHNFEDEVKIKK